MCEDCGAAGSECEARFHEFLAKEFEDPGYGAVHNLTVSTYMLQHSSRLTREGWLYERELLREFIIAGKTPEQVRKERDDTVDNGKRSFKIKSRAGKPVIPPTSWTWTVLDVRAQDVEQYRKDITAWATATLVDSEKISI